MFGSQLAGMLVYQGDRVLISAIGSPAIAGAYALCVNVANKTLAAVVALTTFVFPHATALHVKGGRAEIEALVQALDRSVIIVVIPLIIPGWVLAEPFLSLWLGQFSNAELAMAFRILWVAFAIPALAVPIGNVLISSGRATLAARFSWLTVFVVFGSITLLVPGYGLIGAAIAVLLGMSTSFLFSISARRAMQISGDAGSRRFYLGVGCGVLAQGAVLAVLGAIDGWLELLGAGVVAWSIFYLVRAVLRLMSPEEVRFLKQVAAFRHSALKP
jgi:O-antigen/teichoic acid export membrane protein